MNFASVAEQYDHIRRVSPNFNDFMSKAAKHAHNEAEFERDLNNEIEKIAKELSVDLLFRQQYTLATGRADAVYNRFIIEYEPPDSLRNYLSHKHTQHAVQQVKDYIEGVAKAEKHDRDRLLGVAMDGHYFVFVRYHDGHYIVEEPIAASAASCEWFLRALFSLSSGRALIPENLVEDFGNQNILSQQVTRSLYNALENHADDLTAKLFSQWMLFFGETAGADAAAGKLKHKKELHSFARGMGLRASQVDMPRFFFALHTYFSFLVKNIARLVLQAYAGGALGTTPLTTVANLEGTPLHRELQNLESGGIFRTLGIKNLLEGDFFSWYLSAWDEEIEDALRRVLTRLADYNPVTVQDDPHSARDLLKKLYHYLLPREIRHDLGEFYTPDWLAERLLRQLGEPLFQIPKPGKRIPTPNKRLLDPACGSGTFLVLAARALKANCAQAGLAEGDTLEIILNSVEGLDGIWTRVLKNAFMLLFMGSFDYVVGNPPWINWETLPQAYREKVAPLWQHYAFFQHKGFDAILGKAKDDLSTLMTYVAADRYLKDGGKLGFVITQSVWKTSGGGQGFRRFRIGENGAYLGILHVDDLSNIQVFEGASTRTSVFVLRKGQQIRYPVPYTYWKKTTRGKGLDYDSTLEEVLPQTKRLQFYASPVDANDPTSAWLTARRKALDAVHKVLGPSDYQARARACTWANAVYWLEILAGRPDGLLVVRNVTEGAKRKVEAITTELEPDLVYPLLRGRDVRRWQAEPTYHILLTHRKGDRLNAIPEKEMQQRYPKTWANLKRFEGPLRERSGFKRYFTRKQSKQIIETGPFYSVFNVGDYTFGEWKVVWPNMGNNLVAAVVSTQNDKTIVPQHIVTLVALDTPQEAHYIAACVNSSPFQFGAHSYSQSGGKSFGTPQILKNLFIPKFAPEKEVHIQLSELSQRAHELAFLAYAGDEAAQAELWRVELEVDQAATQLWGLTDEELADIRASLKELKG